MSTSVIRSMHYVLIILRVFLAQSLHWYVGPQPTAEPEVLQPLSAIYTQTTLFEHFFNAQVFFADGPHFRAQLDTFPTPIFVAVTMPFHSLAPDVFWGKDFCVKHLSYEILKKQCMRQYFVCIPVGSIHSSR